MKQTEQLFEKWIEKNVSLKYLLYLPPKYEAESTWPLVLFLHGMGQRGGDLDLIKKHGDPQDCGRAGVSLCRGLTAMSFRVPVDDGVRRASCPNRGRREVLRHR